MFLELRCRWIGFLTGTFLGLVCVLPAGAASADLPPLLEFLDGAPVKIPADWDRRREEISGLMTRYFTGTVPAQAPRLIGAEVLEVNAVGGSIRRRVRLTFDTRNQVSFEVRVWTPEGGVDAGSQGRPLLSENCCVLAMKAAPASTFRFSFARSISGTQVAKTGVLLQRFPKNR